MCFCYNTASMLSKSGIIIRGTSCEKLYHELRPGYIHQTRCMRHFCLYYKTLSTKMSMYIYKLVFPKKNSLRYPKTVTRLSCRTDLFKKKISFHSVLNACSKLDLEIQDSIPEDIFSDALLKSIRLPSFKACSINDPIGLKMITRRHVGLSHLREHKFKQNINDTLIPLCFFSILSINVYK